MRRATGAALGTGGIVAAALAAAFVVGNRVPSPRVVDPGGSVWSGYYGLVEVPAVGPVRRIGKLASRDGHPVIGEVPCAAAGRDLVYWSWPDSQVCRVTPEGQRTWLRVPAESIPSLRANDCYAYLDFEGPPKDEVIRLDLATGKTAALPRFRRVLAALDGLGAVGLGTDGTVVLQRGSGRRVIAKLPPSVQHLDYDPASGVLAWLDGYSIHVQLPDGAVRFGVGRQRAPMSIHVNGVRNGLWVASHTWFTFDPKAVPYCFDGSPGGAGGLAYDMSYRICDIGSPTHMAILRAVGR